MKSVLDSKVSRVLLFLVFTGSTAFAGNIYVQKYNSSDVIKVYVTHNRSDADLFVWVSKYRSDATGQDAIWCYTESSSTANTHKIMFVDYKSDANLVIHLVNDKNDAGWKTSNKYVGQLR